MTRWRWTAFGLAVYALVLIAAAPATLVDAGLRDASDGRLRIADAQGTLWSGAGQLELRDARGRSGVAKPLTWRLRPGELLRARLGFEVALETGSRPFPVTLSASRIELADAEIDLPAAALGYLVPRLAALGLTGDVHVQVPTLTIGHGATRGNATLQWRNAGSALSPVSPLGEYELHLAGDGPAVRVSLATLKGPLQLDGQGAWGDGRKAAFAATARMPAEFQPKLAPFLRLIAVERGDGSFALQIR